jgi:alpha-glucosidase
MLGSYKLVAYGRFNRNEAVVVVLNDDYEPRQVSLHMRRLGVLDGSRMVRIMETTEEGYTMDNAEFYVQNNTLTLTVPKISATVFRYVKA